MCQPNFLAMTTTVCLLRLSSVPCQQPWKLPSTTLFSLDCCFWGHKGVPPCIGRWNWYTKLGPFFSASFFDCHFQPNNNQTFIVCVKSTLILYRKGLCVFSQFQNSPRKIFRWNRSVVSIKDQKEYHS